MRRIELLHRVRGDSLLAFLASIFITAGGVIHLRLWLDLYRHLPASSPGASVVRVGFPINVAVSAVVAGALLFIAARPRSRAATLVICAAVAFQVASLATLVATRTGSVLGWSEPSWIGGPEQSRAVEVGALLALVALAAVRRLGRAEHDGAVSPRPVAIVATAGT
jgi:hypothetical protein